MWRDGFHRLLIAQKRLITFFCLRTFTFAPNRPTTLTNLLGPLRRSLCLRDLTTQRDEEGEDSSTVKYTE